MRGGDNVIPIEKLAEELKLLGDKTRLSIIALLRERELCVCELVELLNTSQPNVSQHMRKLKDGGLVKEDKRGQWVYYTLSLEEKPYVQQLLGCLPDQKDRVDSVRTDCC